MLDAIKEKLREDVRVFKLKSRETESQNQVIRLIPRRSILDPQFAARYGLNWDSLDTTITDPKSDIAKAKGLLCRERLDVELLEEIKRRRLILE